MFYNSCSSGEVTDFRKLGTGHKQTKVVAVDQDHHILFIARVLHNRPMTWVAIYFDNKRRFDLRSRTVGNQKVSLFLWTEEWQRRWLRQCEIEKASHWMEGARPEDVFVFADFVAEESGRPKSEHDPFFVIPEKREIQKRLPELGFVQLRRLTAMLYPSEQSAA